VAGRSPRWSSAGSGDERAARGVEGGGRGRHGCCGRELAALG
jgi:hypothetical protein